MIHEGSEISTMTNKTLGSHADRITIALMAFSAALTLALSVNPSGVNAYDEPQTLNIPPLPNTIEGI